MTRYVIFGLTAVTSLVFAAQAVSAHHSFASEFDRDKPITLTGTVTKVEWTNPHGRFFVDVKDAAGVVTSWEIEQGSVNSLFRGGWTRTTLKAGDVVTVNGFLARETPHLVAASNAPATITLPDGRTYAPGSKMPPLPTR